MIKILLTGVKVHKPPNRIDNGKPLANHKGNKKLIYRLGDHTCSSKGSVVTMVVLGG